MWFAQPADEEKDCHERRDLLRDVHQARHSADQDRPGDQRKHRTRRPWKNAEGGQTGGADGIHLNHAPHASERNDDCNGEKSRQKAPGLQGKASRMQ